jgi:hypothetical protein
MNPPQVSVDPRPHEIPEKINGDEQADEQRKNASYHSCAIKLPRPLFRKTISTLPNQATKSRHTPKTWQETPSLHHSR